LVAFFADGAEDLEFDPVLGPPRRTFHTDEVLKIANRDDDPLAQVAWRRSGRTPFS
jgi:hypothetical protein